MPEAASSELRASSCASSTGTIVTVTAIRATTFVTGRFRGRNSTWKIQMGNVGSLPRVNVVTMISSNDRANASTPPASRAVARFGTITYRNVCQPDAPRSAEASTTFGDIRRRRATTLL
jgi:hypothetical protein